MMQVSDFLSKFGISTVAINEDTPNCPVLWSAISEGKVSHLIVHPEQCSLYHGHLPKMARLLHDPKFVSRVAAVAADECHNIYMTSSFLQIFIPQCAYHGNKAETAAARGSMLIQNLGIVRHYHADLSPEYLEDAYANFADPDGMCLILHATAGAGEGLDVAGRAGRSTDADAFCVQMIEPWVDTSEMAMDPNDPDRPLSDVALTKKHPTKQERTGRASIVEKL
ncbi:Werner syndrome ATP-dependent helicase [Mycena venus]|uniref:Werner syndrome ATP-dependent helicase n=1 Tax=Mycena venus TaxID=2733690 RepID=A0A8H6U1P7_9AGAR|nr:Werner syndrome ATP-dependent helicase [Mycena venus]